MSIIFSDDINDNRGEDLRKRVDTIYDYIAYMKEQLEFWARNRTREISNTDAMGKTTAGDLADLAERVESLEESSESEIESGETGIWSWVKFSSGSAICWSTSYVECPIPADSGYSANVTNTYPFQFTDPPNVTFGLWQNTTSAGNAGVFDIVANTTTALTIRAHRNSGEADNWNVSPTAYIQVMGKWN